jgi:hypothetical protein
VPATSHSPYSPPFLALLGPRRLSWIPRNVESQKSQSANRRCSKLASLPACQPCLPASPTSEVQRQPEPLLNQPRGVGGVSVCALSFSSRCIA